MYYYFNNFLISHSRIRIRSLGFKFFEILNRNFVFSRDYSIYVNILNGTSETIEP